MTGMTDSVAERPSVEVALPAEQVPRRSHHEELLPKMVKTEKWDVFVSYASEDREDVVEPLVQHLSDLGLEVWYDQEQLQVGDRLRREIERGLARCRFGVVVLSPSFLSKHYPTMELDGLAQREHDGQNLILPVWHGITAEQLRQESPTLADRVALSWDEGVEAVATDLVNVIKPDRCDQAKPAGSGRDLRQPTDVSLSVEGEKILTQVARFYDNPVYGHKIAVLLDRPSAETDSVLFTLVDRRLLVEQYEGRERFYRLSRQGLDYVSRHRLLEEHGYEPRWRA